VPSASVLVHVVIQGVQTLGEQIRDAQCEGPIIGDKEVNANCFVQSMNLFKKYTAIQ